MRLLVSLNKVNLFTDSLQLTDEPQGVQVLHLEKPWPRRSYLDLIRKKVNVVLHTELKFMARNGMVSDYSTAESVALK